MNLTHRNIYKCIRLCSLGASVYLFMMRQLFGSVHFHFAIEISIVIQTICKWIGKFRRNHNSDETAIITTHNWNGCKPNLLNIIIQQQNRICFQWLKECLSVVRFSNSLLKWTIQLIAKASGCLVVWWQK